MKKILCPPIGGGHFVSIYAVKSYDFSSQKCPDKTDKFGEDWLL